MYAGFASLFSLPVQVWQSDTPEQVVSKMSQLPESKGHVAETLLKVAQKILSSPEDEKLHALGACLVSSAKKLQLQGTQVQRVWVLQKVFAAPFKGAQKAQKSDNPFTPITEALAPFITSTGERAFLHLLSQNTGSLEDVQKRFALCGQWLCLFQHNPQVARSVLCSTHEKSVATLQEQFTLLCAHKLQLPAEPLCDSLEGRYELTERRITKALSELVVTSTGTINRGIIPLLREKIKSLETTISRFLRRHIHDVLVQLEYNEELLHVLQGVKLPAKAMERSVRVAAGISLDTTLEQHHVLAAIVSALFTPLRQRYFGSCQTAAPLAVVQHQAIALQAHNLVELVANGKITKMVQGNSISYLALPYLFPVSKKVTFINPCIANTRNPESAIKTCIDKIAATPLFAAYLRLCHAQGSATEQKESFSLLIQSLLEAKHADDSMVSLEALLLDMQEIFLPNAIQCADIMFELNASLQHPLLAAWENCITGMHVIPRKYGASGERMTAPRVGGVILWDTLLLETYRAFTATNKPLNMTPLSSFRFTYAQSKGPEQIGWTVRLFYEDDNHTWHPIYDEQSCIERLALVFQKMTGSTLSSQEQQRLYALFQTKFAGYKKPNDLPWEFVSSPSYEKSEIFSSYFQIDSKMTSLFSAVESPRVGLVNLRTIMLAQKTHFASTYYSRLPARVEMDDANHACVALLSERLLGDASQSTEEWLQARELQLAKLTASALGKVIIALHKQVLASCLTECTLEDKKRFLQKMGAHTTGSFFEWCRALGSELATHGTITKEIREKLQSLIFDTMSREYPEIYRLFVIPFADTNWMTVDRASGELIPLYFCFAYLVPLDGSAVWGTAQISARALKNKKREISFPKIGGLKIFTEAGLVLSQYNETNKQLVAIKKGLKRKRS